MKHFIESIELTSEHIGKPVIYLPTHAKGDINHPKAEQGKILSWNSRGIVVDYFYNKCLTEGKNLRWVKK